MVHLRLSTFLFVSITLAIVLYLPTSSHSFSLSWPSLHRFSHRIAASLHNSGQGYTKHTAFWNDRLSFKPPPSSSRVAKSRPPTTLFGGVGIAANYTWKEEQYEIELKVSVPPGINGKNINFKARPNGIHLSLKEGSIGNHEEIVLLDGKREMKGKIDIDGTFWSITDVDGTKSAEESASLLPKREITVTIEKMILPPKDQFEVVEFDWGGIYSNEYENEIISKIYDEPEELDIREYAASLGVDIDNINMSMVDKSMFSSGLNMTKSTLDELTKEGYVKEITRQDDGLEFIENGSGEAMPFNSLGDGISLNEICEANGDGNKKRVGRENINIPLIDTPSIWQQSSMPAEEARGVGLDDIPESRMVDTSEEADQEGHPSKMTSEEDNGNEGQPSTSKDIIDPIDLLTVARLKEVLRNENLKVSGTKEELRDRLRNHVTAMVKAKKEFVEEGTQISLNDDEPKDWQ